ncbi:putative receptor-like protein kinase [Dorcoceras hygrometricum]|uniref:non-specific serine/threonine protein kinase n=1 Tax=Dorcoceras hygrometricum TaxID=472368 RepID=A0A2Z7A4V4_9LAMI|nr:putative receptor-like protein kinase [Dorcoceras hygrometricum]
MKCLCILFKEKTKGGLRKSAPNSSKSIASISSNRSIADLRVFSVSELKEATNNFSKSLRIGEGGFGTVYRGMIKPQSGEGEPTTTVAIKKLDPQGWQGHKQWIAEIQFLGVVNHPNLVKLVGYCSSDGERGIQRLLVYEYMPNRSLEDHLFNKAMPTIPWITRLRIILGAARGMAYLHEGLEVKVIYRDFKSSNVLLDQDLNAKLSDFGLAREGPTGDQSHVSTAPIGTHGYAAPEYIETGRVTFKSDVWSFGVVVYEIITGRRTLERNLPLGEQKLLEWVRQFPPNAKRFDMIVDKRLQNQYSPNSVRTIAKLADCCLNKNPKDRPTMNQVVEILNQVIMQEESVARGGDLESIH